MELLRPYNVVKEAAKELVSKAKTIKAPGPRVGRFGLAAGASLVLLAACSTLVDPGPKTEQLTPGSFVTEFGLSNESITTLPNGNRALLGVIESRIHRDVNNVFGLGQINAEGKLVFNPLGTKLNVGYYEIKNLNPGILVATDTAITISPSEVERRISMGEPVLQLITVDQQGNEIARIKPLTISRTEQEAACSSKLDYNKAKIREAVLLDDSQGFIVVDYPIGSCYSASNIEYFGPKGKQTIVPRGGEFPKHEYTSGKKFAEGPMGNLHTIKAGGKTYLVVSQVSPAAGPEDGIFSIDISDAIQGKDTWKIAALLPKAE